MVIYLFRQYVSNMTSACPFAKTATVGGSCPVKIEKNQHKDQKEHDDKVDAKSNDSVVSPKCPFGYDSHTFKLGPLSCMICQALLYQSSKCLPCSHKFCKWVLHTKTITRLHCYLKCANLLII